MEEDTVSVGCGIENHDECMTADLHIVIYYVGGEQYICTCPFKHEGWCIFTIPHSTLVACLSTDPSSRSSLGFQLKIAVKQLHPLPEPPIEVSPYTYNIGPYLIKNTGQQQMLFNPS